MKRALLVAPCVVVVALIQAGVTAAAAEWCYDDPAIHFVDATGQTQTVYLTTYGDGMEHSAAVNAQSYSYLIEYADHGHRTKVKLRVFVPDDSSHHFHVRSVLSTGPNGSGTLLAHHDSDSGKSNDLDFEVRN